MENVEFSISNVEGMIVLSILQSRYKMPRPKSKDELLQLSKTNFEKLCAFVNALSPDEENAAFPEGMLNRNVRDVLAHLHHWHLMMLNWYRIGMAGAKPDMPAKGFTWKTTGALNRKIRDEYQNMPLGEVKTKLHQSFHLVQEVIHAHSDEELFEKKRYPWTGSTSLGAYLVSATSSHYDWALKLMKKALKECRM